MSQQSVVDVATLLAKLAEAERAARDGEAEAAEFPGLAKAQRIVRDIADWPTEADSDR